MNNNRKMRVKLKSNKSICIHNDLSNAAFYFKDRIRKRIDNNDRDGIFLEMIAGLTMTAFAMEANINFVGAKILGEDWNERDAYWKKVRQVIDAIGIETDYDERPFSCIEKMKTLRDALAHGKPECVSKEEIVVGTYDELEAQRRLSGSWEEMVTLDNVENWYDDMNEIWNLMLEAAAISVFDTITQGSQEMNFIEYVDE